MPKPYIPPEYHEARFLTDEEARTRALAWLLSGSTIHDWIPMGYSIWMFYWERQIRKAAKELQDAQQT